MKILEKPLEVRYRFPNGISVTVCKPTSTETSFLVFPSLGTHDMAYAREFAQAILMACDKADELNGEKK